MAPEERKGARCHHRPSHERGLPSDHSADLRVILIVIGTNERRLLEVAPFIGLLKQQRNRATVVGVEMPTKLITLAFNADIE